MHTEAHPLESFFYQAVRSSYEGKLGLNDPEMTLYVARMLCEFSEPENLSKLRTSGFSLESIRIMVQDSDPVHGTAPSFEAERRIRKYIGDSTLFIAGMYVDTVDAESTNENESERATLDELIRIGKESYYVVSQFDVFEYEKDAALFDRLSEHFERCVLGLSLIRKDLGEFKALPPAAV
ncbi:MAG TPA: hypothetical protein VKR52_10580 [Terracidiphilus sp.]|nr:hypothetical protein [Terracidiphilus sp.]